MPKPLLTTQERRHELLVALVRAPGKKIKFSEAKKILRMIDQNVYSWLCENADLDVYESDGWVCLGYKAAVARQPLIKTPLTNGVGGSWIH